jgi:lysophospholipase L1-like esterase
VNSASPSSPKRVSKWDRTWPLLGWLSQSLLPLALLGVYLVRPVAPGWRGRTIQAGCCIWLIAVIAVASWRKSRDVLIARRRKLLFSTLVVLSGVGLLDLGLTISKLVPTLEEARSQSLKYRESAYTMHRLRPNQEVRDPQGDPVVINSRGFRGPEVVVPKPKGTLRLILLGGSQVFDYEGGEWPRLLERILQSQLGQVEVVNAGVPGHRTPDSLGKLLSELWQLEPDLILVCQAWNDIKYFAKLDGGHSLRDYVKPYRERPGGGDWRLYPRGLDSVLCASAFYRFARARAVAMIGGREDNVSAPTGVVGTFGPLQYELTLRAICSLGKTLKAPVALCQQARGVHDEIATEPGFREAYPYSGLPHDELHTAFAKTDEIVSRVAKEENALLIDCSTPMSGQREYFSDHIHFSPAGSAKVAQIVARGLLPTLRERFR